MKKGYNNILGNRRKVAISFFFDTFFILLYYMFNNRYMPIKDTSLKKKQLNSINEGEDGPQTCWSL